MSFLDHQQKSVEFTEKQMMLQKDKANDKRMSKSVEPSSQRVVSINKLRRIKDAEDNSRIRE